MGEVYEADQTALQRRVALKVLREELVKDPTYCSAFQAEARTIAEIQHPNIVSVHHHRERGQVHFIAMEFVDGRNLREHITRQGALEEKEVVCDFSRRPRPPCSALMTKASSTGTSKPGFM